MKGRFFVGMAVMGLFSPFLYRWFKMGKRLYMLTTFEENFTFNTVAPYAKVGDTCDAAFQRVKEVYNVHTMEDAERIIRKTKEPIIFKKFLEDPAYLLERVMDAAANSSMEFTVMDLHCFGNAYLGGATPIGVDNCTLTELLDENFLYKENKTKALFASFMPMQGFLDEEGLKMISPPNAVADTSFASNFPTDTLATAIHSAPMVHSYSVQVAGKKLWIFIPPHIVEKFEPYSASAAFPIYGSEAELFEAFDGIVPLALQEPGDFLYFPPHWAHSVTTMKGPNMMFNFRVVDVNPISHLKRGTFFRMIESIGSKILEKIIDWDTNASKRHFSHQNAKPYELIRRQIFADVRREVRKFDSPCKGIWTDLMNAK